MNFSSRIFALERFTQLGAAPLYTRLRRMVQDAVTAGELRGGDQIPSERDVAEALRISRVTVRKAFSDLVAEGVLEQRRGSGTYIKGQVKRIEQPLSRLTSFSEDMQSRGMATDADWLDRSCGLPTPEESLKLSISPHEHVSRFHRLRRADGVPLAIELAIVPRQILPDPLSVTGSLYAALGERGAKPVRALQRLHATALSARVAKLLGQAEGSPGLFVERISYLADNTTVEYTRSHYRGDIYDFVAELTLVPQLQA